MRFARFSLCLMLCLAGCSNSGRRGGSASDATASDSGGFQPTPTDASTDAVEQPICFPGQKSCQGNAWIACQFDGSGWTEPTGCSPPLQCNQGICTPCQPDERICQGLQLRRCDGTGGTTLVEECEAACASGNCVACTPGVKECRLSGEVYETWECVPTGPASADWQKTATCSEASDCKSGICINPCQADLKLNTNQGCDYYALDLPNFTEPSASGGPSAEDAQFAVIVSNPSQKDDLQVTVHETHHGEAVESRTVAPGGLEIIPLGPRNIVGTTQGDLAWRIKANRPFVAYQFNPLDNQNPVFSNDASLLLPQNALGRDYIVMTGNARAFVAVVGTTANTEVTVTASAPTLGGAGIPALSAGQSFTTTLDAGEVLNIRAGPETPTLTGTIVAANRNVAVFGGNVAATTSDRCCADHLEQQMFPVSAWGTKVVCTKSTPRQAEPDHWRVLAREDDTHVTFTSEVSGPVTLQRGEFVDVATTRDFVVTGDKPILVGQFLASSFEILPDGEYCTSDADCSSGVCSSNDGGPGSCVATCSGAQANCPGSDVCVDNRLFGSGPPPTGGSCLTRICSLGGSCGGASECFPAGDLSICVEPCPGGSCSDTDLVCSPEYGVCTPVQGCTSDTQCGPGGWCATLSDGSTECRLGCTPAQECPNPGEVCLPPGYAADETITVGLCLDVSGCSGDSQCPQGHTCVVDAAVPNGSCQPIGDPAFILAVPSEQFRDDYVFLAPNAYKEDYVNIIAPADADATLDGVPVTSFAPITGSQFKVARLPLTDGAHRITASKPVGIVVYGYHDDVSYGYPGGANLFDLGN